MRSPTCAGARSAGGTQPALLCQLLVCLAAVASATYDDQVYDYLKTVDAVLGEYLYNDTAAQWAYYTNVTDYNAQVLPRRVLVSELIS